MTDLEKKVEKIEVSIDNLRKRVIVLENLGVVAQTLPASKTKELSPREFLNKHIAGNDVERVLLFGFFLEHYRRCDSFNIDDLKEMFYESKVKPSLNINDKINMNVKKGYMMDALKKKDEKKAWVLTGAGEDHINTIKRRVE